MPLRPVSSSPSLIRGDSPAVGEYVPPRGEWSNTLSVAVATGSVYLAYFTADKSETISTLTVWTGTTAAAATPTLCRLAVFSVAANGDLTQVGVTPNDTTLFAAASTAYAKALTSPFSKVAGQRYAVGVLVLTAAAPPSFVCGNVGPSTTGALAAILAIPAIASKLAGQTDMPSSISQGALVGGVFRPAMLLS